MSAVEDKTVLVTGATDRESFGYTMSTVEKGAGPSSVWPSRPRYSGTSRFLHQDSA